MRVSGETARRIKQKCDEENLSVYAYAGDLLEQAFIYDYKGTSDQLLAPHIRSAVRQEINQMMENLMEMMIRSYMEAGTARRMVQASLILPPQLDRERVRELERRNWDSTYKELREDIKGFGNWRRLLVDDPLINQAEMEEEESSPPSSK
ncbi:hypothetical protein DEMA109039_18215 [Deinococcus marmoris]